MILKLNEKHYFLDRQAVEEALIGVEPGFKGKYFIEANGVRFPAKQAISRCIGVRPIRIQTAHALAILEKAGFEIIMGGQSDGE